VQAFPPAVAIGIFTAGVVVVAADPLEHAATATTAAATAERRTTERCRDRRPSISER
jgi:hypothetical protein